MREPEIRKLFADFGATLNKGDVWAVQGTPVIYHKALERLAAAAKITFGTPTVLRSERDEAVLLVTGSLGDRTEWSIGEALVNVNYRVSGKQAAYVYAMAEKRGRDRVILKLAGLHGLYSEEEADEFKAGRGAADPEPEPARAVEPIAMPIMDESARRYLDKCEADILAETDAAALKAWWNSNERKSQFRAFDVDEGTAGAIKSIVVARLDALQREAA